MAKRPPVYYDPVFLTPKEVAHLLRVSQGWVYRMLHKDMLPYILIGKKQFRIHIKDLRLLNPHYATLVQGQIAEDLTLKPEGRVDAQPDLPLPTPPNDETPE